MLELSVFDGKKNVVLEFEHSLLSLSKWEQRHRKPFLSKEPKLHTEMIDYYQDMLLTPRVDRSIILRLAPENLDALSKYINEYPGASSVPRDPDEQPPVNEQITTNELIYSWLTMLRIPFQPTETWHVNRIMMLIGITNFLQTPEDKRKKRSPAAVMKDWRAENERRLAMFKTKG